MPRCASRWGGWCAAWNVRPGAKSWSVRGVRGDGPDCVDAPLGRRPQSRTTWSEGLHRGGRHDGPHEGVRGDGGRGVGSTAEFGRKGGGFMRGWLVGFLAVTVLASPVAVPTVPAAMSVKTVKAGVLTVAIDNDMPFCKEDNGKI